MTSRSNFAYVMTLLLTLGGCREKANPAAADLDCKGEICTAPIAAAAIAITDPAAAMTYTNKDLTIKVAVTPMAQAPAKIELLEDGAHLADVNAPFSFTWTIAQEVDGPHKFKARATVDGQTVTSQEITVVVDRVAPTVVQTTTRPASGATNVALSDPIQVTFSEPVKPGTVPSNAITLTDVGTTASLNAVSTLSADGTQLTVSTWNRSELFFPATIKESLAATITDLAGNALTPPAPWMWNAPLWVQMPAIPGRAPSLALDDAGQPTIAFTKPDASNSSATNGPIGIARYAEPSTWDRTVAAPTSSPIFYSALALDGMNRPIVAWDEQNHIRAARLSGSTWEALGGDADAALADTHPKAVSSMALDASGMPTIAIWDYVSQMGPPSGYIVRLAGSSWQLLNAAAMPFPTSGGGPVVQIDSTGAPVVWSSMLMQRLVAGNWLTINLGSQYTSPTFVLDGQDRPILAGQTNLGSTITLDARMLVQNTWQVFGNAPLANNSSGFSEVHLALDHAGHPLIVWRQGSSTTPDLLVAAYNGTTFVSPYGTVNAVAGGSPAHVQLAVDAHGSPVIAFDEYDAASMTTSVYVWKSNL